MLTRLTEWLNGPHAGLTMLLLRLLFFSAFVTAATLLAAERRRGTVTRSRPGFLLLSLLTFAAWLAILTVQFNWQILGARNVEFMRFVRTHNKRPANLARRGEIIDRNGTVLATDAPRPGAPWGRRYPLGAATAHLVGYFDPRYGLAGMERSGDLVLSGIGGTAREELVRLGRNILAAPQPEGNDLQLTLDARLQRRAFELMDGKRGAIVVLNATSGDVLTLLSMPSFDPHQPGAYQDNRVTAPLLNRALQGLYPPGSTFKVVMTALAGEQRLTPVFNCPADGFRAAADARPIRDSEYYIRKRDGRSWQGWGRIGLRQAFIHSSNVYFAQLGLAVPAAEFNSMIAKLSITNAVVLHESSVGRIATRAGSVPLVGEADRRMRSQLAIGQGRMVVTPFHVALWTAAVANGGLLHAPSLTVAGERLPARQVLQRTVALNTAALMREAVLNGTGRAVDLPGLALCGKTGTAEAPGGSDHAWFTCFNSEGEPRLVVTVLVERGGYGSRGALPLARALFEEALRLELIRSR